MLRLLILCAFLGSIEAKPGAVTFKNVIVGGYSMFTHKFNVTITSSNNLKENLPNKVFDKLEILHCQIPVLREDSISDIEDLDELILDDDEIVNIEAGAFKNVPQLRKLVITNNKLESINEEVFNKLNIATLDLSKNSINSIASGAFNNMPDLLNINLADNKLKRWDKNWFANTPLLTRVSFQNNLIEEIPEEAFKNFQGDKQFGSVSLTINIILSHNQIKTIHANSFNGLKKINNLWLDYNELDTWDENVLTGVEVKTLRIDHNKLQCLDGNLEKYFIAETTHLDGNPWDCGCLKNIKLWASEHDKEIVLFYSSLTCDAARIDQKIKNLNQLLKELKKNNTDITNE